MMTTSAPAKLEGTSRSHRSTPRKVRSGPYIPPRRGTALVCHSGFEDDAAANHGRGDLDVTELCCGRPGEVAVENRDVGKHAVAQPSFRPLRVFRVGAARR